MKTRVLGFLTMFLLGTSMVFAQAKTEKFEVKGNCGMCETRIEKAAGAVEGVINADWSTKTKMLSVKYETDKVKLIDIHKAVAKVGHDTALATADDKTYNKLPGCCKYDRQEKKKDDKKKSD